MTNPIQQAAVLPPLPEPFMAVFTVNGRLTPELQQRYEQQMHDYGRACIAAASARRAAQTAPSAGEVERDRKDAERYRWICEQDHKDRQWVETFAEFKAQRDARIDAALSHKEQR